MPSPQRLYEFYTDEELETEQVALKAEMTNGTFTSLGGAAKSSSIARVPVQERIRSLNLEFRKRGLSDPRVDTVSADFRHERPYGYRGNFYT